MRHGQVWKQFNIYIYNEAESILYEAYNSNPEVQTRYRNVILR